ncbi:Choline O-acetyltransferase [Eumeta japonica]|uniref:Choline O-acetyltransferase n=1 Tax=Eumeta variegata TaxID=151549 RepID=A0A4C1YFU0_EUMVA|nr:Choline O-acetyltransferase [Eumeta japonica]
MGSGKRAAKRPPAGAKFLDGPMKFQVTCTTRNVKLLILNAWGESLLALPRRWLGAAAGSRDTDDPRSVQLPKLPLPPLQATLDTYLELATAIVAPSRLERTRALVKAFAAADGPGPQLQAILEDRRERMDNWITDWWLEDMYLKVRLPLTINSNPGMVFPKRRFAKMEEVADLGALFIDDLLDYKEMLDRGELPLERATSREKGQPLCMEQFYRLLGVCRVPELGKDRLELPPINDEPIESSEELVIVACRNYSNTRSSRQVPWTGETRTREVHFSTLYVYGGMDNKIDDCEMKKNRRLDMNGGECMNETEWKGSGRVIEHGSFETYWGNVDQSQRGS